MRGLNMVAMTVVMRLFNRLVAVLRFMAVVMLVLMRALPFKGRWRWRRVIRMATLMALTVVVMPIIVLTSGGGLMRLRLVFALCEILHDFGNTLRRTLRVSLVIGGGRRRGGLLSRLSV